jgi:mutator protein MutT
MALSTEPTKNLAVRALVENARGEILLLRRSNTSRGEGQWCLPGGKVDKGEKIQASVLRELQEETGIKSSKAEFFLFIDEPLALPDGNPYITFFYHVKTDAKVAIELSESSEYEWVKPKRALTMSVIFGGNEAIRCWLKRKKR